MADPINPSNSLISYNKLNDSNDVKETNTRTGTLNGQSIELSEVNPTEGLKNPDVDAHSKNTDSTAIKDRKLSLAAEKETPTTRKRSTSHSLKTRIGQLKKKVSRENRKPIPSKVINRASENLKSKLTEYNSRLSNLEKVNNNQKKASKELWQTL